jgi:hypothetical protein
MSHWLKSADVKETAPHRQYVRAVILYLRLEGKLGLRSWDLPFIDTVVGGYRFKMKATPSLLKKLHDGGLTEVKKHEASGYLFIPAKPYPGLAKLEKQYSELK